MNRFYSRQNFSVNLLLAPKLCNTVFTHAVSVQELGAVVSKNIASCKTPLWLPGWKQWLWLGPFLRIPVCNGNVSVHNQSYETLPFLYLMWSACQPKGKSYQAIQTYSNSTSKMYCLLMTCQSHSIGHGFYYHSSCLVYEQSLHNNLRLKILSIPDKNGRLFYRI